MAEGVFENCGLNVPRGTFKNRCIKRGAFSRGTITLKQGRLEKIPKYPSPCSQARKVDEYLYFFVSSFLVLKRHSGFRKYTNLSRNFEPASEEDKISVYYLKPLLVKRKIIDKKKPRTSPRLYFKAT